MTARNSILAGALAVMVAASLYLSRLGSTPEGQPPVARLETLDAFREDFNAAADTTRVLISVSPTCPYCLKGTTVAQEVLDKHAGEPVTVFVVWQPVLPTDWVRPGSSVMSRMPDLRVRQYWDPDHLVAEAMGTAGEARQQYPDCCYEDGLWWDFLAAFPPGPRWEEMAPEAALLNGTVEDASPALDTLLARMQSALP